MIEARRKNPTAAQEQFARTAGRQPIERVAN
jgi:hypothetical protein